MSEEIIQLWGDKEKTVKQYPVTTTEAIVSPSGKSVAQDVREQVAEVLSDVESVKSSALTAAAAARLQAGYAQAQGDLVRQQIGTLKDVYHKPSTGIPETDLSQAVRDKLNSGGIDESNLVHKTGDETIEGKKVFTEDAVFDGNMTKFGGDVVTDTDFYQRNVEGEGAFEQLTALSSKIGELETGKQDVISDLEQIRHGAANGATAEEIREAMENLPDGSAVSAQVAVNTAKVSELEGVVSDSVSVEKQIEPTQQSGYWMYSGSYSSSTSTTFVTYVCPIEGYRECFLSCRWQNGNYLYAYYAFCDANGSPIEMGKHLDEFIPDTEGGTYETWDNVKLAIPSGAVTLQVTIRNLSSFKNVFSLKAVNNAHRFIYSKDLESGISELEGIAGGSLNILCCGNSLTIDSMSYVPFLIKNLLPKAKLKVGILYKGSSNLSTLADLFDGASSDSYTYYLYDNEHDEWVTQKEIYSADVDDLLTSVKWDIITYQQVTSRAALTYSTLFEPQIIRIQKSIASRIDYGVKFGWILTHTANVSSYADQGFRGLTNDELVLQYEKVAENAQKVMENTATDILFPYGTAVQNLRSIPIMRTYGTPADSIEPALKGDNTHLQEGIGALCANYANALTIMKSLGYDCKSIIGDQTLPSERIIEYLRGHNIPLPNWGDNTSIGITEVKEGGGGIIGMTPEYIYLAQLAAVFALKRPYEITDLNKFA